MYQNKEATDGYLNCNTIFSYNVKESLYARVIVWVNIVVNHNDTRTLLPTYQNLAWCIGPNGMRKKISANAPNTVMISRKCKVIIVDTRVVSKK